MALCILSICSCSKDDDEDDSNEENIVNPVNEDNNSNDTDGLDKPTPANNGKKYKNKPNAVVLFMFVYKNGYTIACKDNRNW